MPRLRQLSREQTVIQYIELPCPNCQKGLRIRSAYIRKKVACKECNHAFFIKPKDIPVELTLLVLPVVGQTDAARQQFEQERAALEG